MKTIKYGLLCYTFFDKSILFFFIVFKDVTLTELTEWIHEIVS